MTTSLLSLSIVAASARGNPFFAQVAGNAEIFSHSPPLVRRQNDAVMSDIQQAAMFTGIAANNAKAMAAGGRGLLPAGRGRPGQQRQQQGAAAAAASRAPTAADRIVVAGADKVCTCWKVYITVCSHNNLLPFVLSFQRRWSHS